MIENGFLLRLGPNFVDVFFSFLVHLIPTLDLLRITFSITARSQLDFYHAKGLESFFYSTEVNAFAMQMRYLESTRYILRTFSQKLFIVRFSPIFYAQYFVSSIILALILTFAQRHLVDVSIFGHLISATYQQSRLLSKTHHTRNLRDPQTFQPPSEKLFFDFVEKHSAED